MTVSQKALIGASFEDQRLLEAILELGVTRDDFTAECKLLWIDIEKMYAKGIPVTVGKAYERVPEFIDLIEECTENSPKTESQTIYFADSVKREALLRKAHGLILEAQDFIETANADNAEEVIAEIQKQWIDLRINKVDDKAIHEHIGEFIQQCDEGEIGVIPWFLTSLQERYGKLVEEFIVVHAQPSVGKTAFVVQWMTYLHRNGYKAALASLESSKKGIAPRFLSHIGQVNTLLMKNGNGFPDDKKKAQKAFDEAKELAFNVKDGHMTDGQLMAWCKIQKQNGVQIIFIDNLRHIDSVTKYDSEVRKFMEISLAVKRIRDELGIPVVLLHHSNEDGDVGWSKDIKKDVDALIYLDKREGEYGAFVDKVDFVFQKGRDTGTFTIETLFQKDMQTYREI